MIDAIPNEPEIEIQEEPKKICCHCKQELPISCFSKAPAGKYKRCSMCKECYKIYRTEYDKKRKEEGTHTYEVDWAKSTRNCHKALGYIVTITNKELTEMARNTKVCPICGREFKPYGNGKMSDLSPSLDRIDNENELRADNVQIICHQCNASKSNRTMEEFIEYCHLVASRFPKK